MSEAPKKPNQLSQRARMRQTLLAAVAAASFNSEPAQASGWSAETRFESPQVADKKTKTPRAKQSPDAKRPAIRIPDPQSVELMGGYLKLVEKMIGRRLIFTGITREFPAYEAFCREFERYCQRFADHRRGTPYLTKFSPELFARISTVNEHVNRKITPRSDIEIYGIKEKWVVPESEGDCEDYVLLKMLMLLDLGISPTALHIVIVFDENGDGHAVLGVDVFENNALRTLILDNRGADIITLDEMEEKYRGSYTSFVTQDAEGKLRVEFHTYHSRNDTQPPRY